MGGFFDEVFLPTMKKLVEAGLSYDEVKRLVKIPTTWGAKITGEQFRERASKFEPSRADRTRPRVVNRPVPNRLKPRPRRSAQARRSGGPGRR